MWSARRPGRFIHGKDPAPFVQEAGWASGPVWTGAENLAPSWIRSPARPGRSESLYRLSYRGPKDYPELYVNIQSVPRSKHSVSVIKTSQLMLYREIMAVCSEIHTKHINTAVWAERGIVEC